MMTAELSTEVAEVPLRDQIQAVLNVNMFIIFHVTSLNWKIYSSNDFNFDILQQYISSVRVHKKQPINFWNAIKLQQCWLLKFS